MKSEAWPFSLNINNLVGPSKILDSHHVQQPPAVCWFGQRLKFHSHKIVAYKSTMFRPFQRNPLSHLMGPRLTWDSPVSHTILHARWEENASFRSGLIKGKRQQNWFHFLLLLPLLLFIYLFIIINSKSRNHAMQSLKGMMLYPIYFLCINRRAQCTPSKSH